MDAKSSSSLENKPRTPVTAKRSNDHADIKSVPKKKNLEDLLGSPLLQKERKKRTTHISSSD